MKQGDIPVVKEEIKTRMVNMTMVRELLRKLENYSSERMTLTQQQGQYKKGEQYDTRAPK